MVEMGPQDAKKGYAFSRKGYGEVKYGRGLMLDWLIDSLISF